jgi:transcriptional regulator with XRE-family HTH domain
MREREIQFGKLVRATREAAGYSSQPKLAKAAGIGQRSVASVELGEVGVGRKVRAAIARTLGMDPDGVEDYIAGKSDALPSPSPTSAGGRDSESSGPDARPDPLGGLTAIERELVLASSAEITRRMTNMILDVGLQRATEWLEAALELRDQYRPRLAEEDRSKDTQRDE